MDIDPVLAEASAAAASAGAEAVFALVSKHAGEAVRLRRDLGKMAESITATAASTK
jgi:hypothetical protein